MSVSMYMCVCLDNELPLTALAAHKHSRIDSSLNVTDVFCCCYCCLSATSCCIFAEVNCAF